MHHHGIEADVLQEHHVHRELALEVRGRRLAPGDERPDTGEGEEQTAAFDCFLLTRTAFFPSGKLKPGERSGKADDGYFAFEPPPGTEVSGPP